MRVRVRARVRVVGMVRRVRRRRGEVAMTVAPLKQALTPKHRCEPGHASRAASSRHTDQVLCGRAAECAWR